MKGVQGQIEEGESLGLCGIAVDEGFNPAGAEEAGDEAAKEGGSEGLGGGELVPSIVGGDKEVGGGGHGQLRGRKGGSEGGREGGRKDV